MDSTLSYLTFSQYVRYFLYDYVRQPVARHLFCSELRNNGPKEDSTIFGAPNVRLHGWLT
jgi:hypothetical protein